MGDHGLQCQETNLLGLDYADDLSILDQNVNKMKEFLNVL